MSAATKKVRIRGRVIADFVMGLAGVTAAVGAALGMPGIALGWALAAMAAVGAVAVALLRFRRASRPLALGMLCGLMAPALIAGSACIPIPLEYRQPPLPSAKPVPPPPRPPTNTPPASVQ